MSWFSKKEEVKPIITEKLVMPDMSKYATSESLERMRQEIISQNLLTNREVAKQFESMSKSIESLRKLIEERKPEREEFKLFGKPSGDDKYVAGLDTGFNLGLKYASQLDERAIKQIRDQAISETLGRLNGNKKTN